MAWCDMVQFYAHFHAFICKTFCSYRYKSFLSKHIFSCYFLWLIIYCWIFSVSWPNFDSSKLEQYWFYSLITLIHSFYGGGKLVKLRKLMYVGWKYRTHVTTAIIIFCYTSKWKLFVCTTLQTKIEEFRKFSVKNVSIGFQ